MKEPKAEINELRYECFDWDKPTVQASISIDRKRLRRKVMTRGKFTITLGENTEETIVEALRSGLEVHFADSRGVFGRLFPCLDADYKTMNVCAAALSDTESRIRSCLHDKTVRIVHRGTEVTPRYCERKERENKEAKERQEVTPDMTVTCPECGAEFRVGRKISNRKSENQNYCT